MASGTVWIVFVALMEVANPATPTAANYDRNSLKAKHPDYGTRWMYFPDGEGVPTVGYLENPPGGSRVTNASADELEKSLSFRLYSRVYKKGIGLPSDDPSTLRALFDPRKDTKLVTHGWLSSGASDTCLFIKDAFLLGSDANVVVFDWSEIAGNVFYPVPMARTGLVARHYARFLDLLIGAAGADPKRIHLIGHSLGAHVSGLAGRLMKGKVARITGLDPALPGFVRAFELGRLAPSDADYVDVIHTCAGVLGLEERLGHADFYPNGGGPPQPGCSGVAEIIEACSHGRSWKYFAESVVSSTRFLARRCRSWRAYLNRSCDEELVPMGNPTPWTARGSYYLSTESAPPFASKTQVLGDDVLSNNNLKRK